MEKFKVYVQVNCIMYGTLEVEAENFDEVHSKIYDEENDSLFRSIFPREIRDLIYWYDDGQDGVLYIDDLVIWEGDT
jgi:hypothetical protein